MGQCGFIQSGAMVFDPNQTAAQCQVNNGYWTLSAQDITEAVGPYSWGHGAELFAFAFSAVISIWLVGLVGGLIVGVIRRA